MVNISATAEDTFISFIGENGEIAIMPYSLNLLLWFLDSHGCKDVNDLVGHEIDVIKNPKGYYEPDIRGYIIEDT